MSSLLFVTSLHRLHEFQWPSDLAEIFFQSPVIFQASCPVSSPQFLLKLGIQGSDSKIEYSFSSCFRNLSKSSLKKPLESWIKLLLYVFLEIQFNSVFFWPSYSRFIVISLGFDELWVCCCFPLLCVGRCWCYYHFIIPIIPFCSCF